MKKLGLIVLLVVCGSVLVIPGIAQVDQRSTAGPTSVRALMQRKLESSQGLLKGLAQEDYQLIQREAQKLQVLSLDAGWNIVQTEDYARISAEFRRSLQKLRTAAEAENLDAAGLGFVRLTLTCIDCHQHVRKVAAPAD